ncbi:MAG TPA: iron ABC transporter permease [Streptosporangiaceae bacterium]|jgi:iron(III) transport system permease protein
MKLSRPKGMTVLTAAAVLVAVYLLLVPLVMDLITSVRGTFLPFGLPDIHWGLQNYRALSAGSGGLGSTVLDTAIYAGGAMLVAMLLGSALAWLVARTDLPGQRVISVLVIVPFIIPPIVMAQSYILMLGPQAGVLNELLRVLPWWHGQAGPVDPFSFGTMVVLQGLSLVPFPFLLLAPAMGNMDGSLEEASRMSGASFARTVRTVTLPILWPTMLGLAALTFLLAIGGLAIPLLFGQQSGTHILALRLWYLVTPPGGNLPEYGEAAAYGLVFLVFMAVIFWAYLRSTRSAARRASISGKGYRPRRLPLGKGKPFALAAVILYLLVVVALPAASLIWSSLTPYTMPISAHNLGKYATLSAFPAVFHDPQFWQSLTRTGIIGAASATIACAVAVTLAFASARSAAQLSAARSSAGRANRLSARLIDLLASSSIAIPDVIAGFTAFMLYLIINRWVALSGTIIALILANSYRLAVPYRTAYSAILQVGGELEEAAASSGASRLATFRRVVLPLILPTVLAVWIQLFIVAATDFTLAAFLSNAQSQPLSMYLYDRINVTSGEYVPSQGAAMALIFTVLVAALWYGLTTLNSRKTRDKEPSWRLMR